MAQRSVITPPDLADIPLLCSRHALLQNELAGWLGFSPDQLDIISTYNLLYNASIIVEEGIGCALCIDGLINTSGTSRLCFRPFQPAIAANLVIAWKKYQVFSPAAQKWLQIIQNGLT